MITGKGINPNKPPAPPTADQTGSGKNGVLVTKGGAAAKAIGDGLLAKAQAEAEKKKQREPAKDVGSGAAKHEKTRELTPTEKKRVNRAISKIEQSQFGKTEEGRRVVNALNQKLKNGDIEFANANSPGGGHYHPTKTHGTEAGKDHEHKIHIEAGYLYSTNPHDLEGHLVHEATHALDDADFPTHRDSIENEVRAYENAAVYLGEVDPSNPKVADYYSSANRDEFEKKIRGYENGKLYQDNTDGRYPAPSKIPTKPPTPPLPGSEPIDQIDYGLKVDAYNSYIQWKKEQEFEQSRNDAFPQGTPPHPISPLSNPLKK